VADKRVDMTSLADYERVGEADRDKLAELLIRAKGAKRSMRQFALDCNVNPSTFSRIVNKKTSRSNTDELLFAIAQSADPDSGVTFRDLMKANGKAVRQMTGKIDRGTIAADLEQKAKNIILNEILRRGYSVSAYDEKIRHNALNYWYRSDWAFKTDGVSADRAMKLWEFEFIPCFDCSSAGIRQSLVKMRQKLLMIMGLFYTGDMKPDKFSFVLTNMDQFEILIATLDGTAIKDVFSVILVDTEAGKVQSEYIFPMTDGGEPFKVFTPIEDAPLPEDDGEDLLDADVLLDE